MADVSKKTPSPAGRSFMVRTLIIVVLPLAGGLLYTRGGGGDPDFRGDLINGYFLPAILKPNAIPEVCTDDLAIKPLNEPSNSMKSSTACIVNFPDTLQVTPYCVNKATNWGGANITIPSMDLIHYQSIPKNCYGLENDESLYSRTLACSGAAGSTVKLTVENSCTPPAANLPDVEPSCPAGYSRKSPEDIACHYTPLEPTPFCGDGLFYDTGNGCCRTAKNFPLDVSACPDGYQPIYTYTSTLQFDKIVCNSKAKGAITTDTRSYTITLGTCDVQKPREDSAPAPCILDPLTGMCK